MAQIPPITPTTWIQQIITYILENGLIPQALLLLAVWGSLLFLTLTHQEVPGWLQDAGLAILGYFFHVTQAAFSPGSKSSR